MHHRLRRLSVPLAIVVASVAATAVATAAPPDGAPTPFVNGQAALDRIGDRLPALAAQYGLNPGELQRMLLADPALAVDQGDELAYFDTLEPWAQPAVVDSTAASAPPTTGPEFQLSSLPGAQKTIYLDFDGHVTEGTTWNSAYGVTSIVSPPYDTDGNPDSWSASELSVIAGAWAAVAEDYAPWNVNVTTIDPGTEALRRSGAGDTAWGARVVITDDTFANCGCGGHAYVGAFDDTTDEPTFVYNASFVGVAEAISHEVGHMLLLHHDGTTSGSAYYLGHSATGTPGWAPIMGAGYYQPVTQWSKQEYSGANNTAEDDIAIIGGFGNGNDFGVRADDHGNNLATATRLQAQDVALSGIIETRADVDVFTFTTTSGADVRFSIDVADIRPNLDAALTLRDATGNVVAADNASGALTAGLSAAVPAGTYTVEIDGVGVGNPLANPPTGYTDYGSLGRYDLVGFISDATAPDTQAPAAPAGLAGTESNGAVALSWTANAEADLAGYVVQRDGGSGFADIASPGNVLQFQDATPPTGDVGYRLVAVDSSGNRSEPSNVVVVNIAVDMVRHATADLPVNGTTNGSYAATVARDGVAQRLTEVESGGKPATRYDLAEHRWTIPASVGNQTLTLAAAATDGGDADNGFVFEWSSDGTTWIPVGTVRQGAPLDVTVGIGAPTGSIQLRVVDTDRTKGQRSFDSVSVDFVEVIGDGAVIQRPVPVVSVASIATSQVTSNKGSVTGVATVRVTNDLGTALAGASVVVRFTGDFTESFTGTTDGNGTVTFVTSSALRKPVFSACVASVSASLPYAPGSEAC